MVNSGKNSSERTIFKSPFLITPVTSPGLSSDATPSLAPPLKRNNRSPVKRTHKRHRHSIDVLTLGENTSDRIKKAKKRISFLDDNNDEDGFGCELFGSNTPLLEFENPTKPNRSIFDFGISSSDEKNISIFSMDTPSGTTAPFDFNSYLRAVTSNFKNNNSNHSNKLKPTSSRLLDLSKPIKFDILNEKDRTKIFNENIMDDMELDCVVRSSTWESDLDSDDGLNLDLDLDLDLNINTNSGNSLTKKESRYDSINNSTPSKSSPIPSLIDPFHKIVVSPNKSSPTFSTTSSNSMIPFQIYSDSKNDQRNSQTENRTFSGDSDKISYDTNDYSNKTDACGKFSPHHYGSIEDLKPALKPIPKCLLNLIVESSDGSLEDATKYATEINAQNCEGIPVPQKTTELVNIPTTAPSINGVRKSAIVRGVRAKSGTKKKTRRYQQLPENNETNLILNAFNRDRKSYIHTVTERKEALLKLNDNSMNILQNSASLSKGFYSLNEKQEFLKKNSNTSPSILSSHLSKNTMLHYDDKENQIIAHSLNKRNDEGSAFKRAKIEDSKSRPLDKKKVNWSTNLEW